LDPTLVIYKHGCRLQLLLLRWFPNETLMAAPAPLSSASRTPLDTARMPRRQPAARARSGRSARPSASLVNPMTIAWLISVVCESPSRGAIGPWSYSPVLSPRPGCRRSRRCRLPFRPVTLLARFL